MGVVPNPFSFVEVEKSEWTPEDSLVVREMLARTFVDEELEHSGWQSK